MAQLRFDWFPQLVSDELDKSVKTLVSRLLLSYEGGKGVKPYQHYQACYEEIGLQTISALYQAHHQGDCIGFPLHPRAFSKTSPHAVKYSSRRVREVYDELTSLGWIKVIQKGVQNKYVTRISACGDLAYNFDQIGFAWMQQARIPRQQLVVLRDVERDSTGEVLRFGKRRKTRKIQLEVPKSLQVELYQDSLEAINEHLRHQCISLDLSDVNLRSLREELTPDPAAPSDVSPLNFMSVQLVRIFSRGSLELGGRFYRGWWQSLPSIHRPHIRINGFKTVEIDYSGMSLAIIYALEKQPLDSSMDPYDLGLSNWLGKADPRRKTIKKIVNALINDEDGVYRISPEFQSHLSMSQELFIEQLTRRHPVLKEKLGTNIGLKTQFIDSQIAEAVMTDLLKEGITVLPIHDSFIVRAGYQRLLADSMKRSFRNLLGTDISIEAEIIKSNSTFGVSNNEVVETFSDDPSLSIVSGEAVMTDYLDYKKRLTTKYLMTWIAHSKD